MDAVRNPCSPGAGRPPVALVGRDTQLNHWDVAVQRIEQGRTAQPPVLYGLRGVGKTVLLTELSRRALGRSWLVARLEAGSGKPLREALGEALHGPLADLARPSAGRRLLRALKTAASFKASYDLGGTWSFGLDLSDVGGGGADTGVLETDLLKLLHDVAAAATEEGRGLAVLIDEAQELDEDELVALCSIAHAAGRDGWALLMGLAGLPSLPRILAEAKSYAERLFAFYPVEHLDGPLAARALAEPAALEHVSWSEDAISYSMSCARRPAIPTSCNSLARTPGTRLLARPRSPSQMPGSAWRTAGRRLTPGSSVPAGTEPRARSSDTSGPWP